MYIEAALIRAVQLAKDGKTKDAAVILDTYSQKHKEKQLILKLAAVQLLLSDVMNHFILISYPPPPPSYIYGV